MSVLTFDTNKVISWWDANFNGEKLESLTQLDQGYSNFCFVLNNKFVLKIYAPKREQTIKEQNWQDFRFKQGWKYQAKLDESEVVPNLIHAYPNNPHLQANAILMQYLDGSSVEAASRELNYFELTDLGNAVGKLIRKFHGYFVYENNLYHTLGIYSRLHSELQKFKSLEGNFKPLINRVEKVLGKYQPKHILCDYVNTHGDLHLNNIIVSNSEVKLIDLDDVELRPAFLDLAKIIYSTIHPVPQNVLLPRSDYAKLLPLLYGLKQSYPEWFTKAYKVEIEIILLKYILESLLSSGFNASDMTRKMEIYMDIFDTHKIFDRLFD